MLSPEYRVVYKTRKRTCLKDVALNKINVVHMLITVIFALAMTCIKSADAKTYALFISGINKDTQDRVVRSVSASNFYMYLTDSNIVTLETVKLLTADNTGNNNVNNSLFENIRKTLNNFESVIIPSDRFIFYYTGQANVVGDNLRFNLPGEDMTQKQLSTLLKNIKASSFLIVLDCPVSGLAVKELSGTGRIIICSCTDEQRFSPKFSEYFVSALTDTKTDIDQNGKVSILEVFIETSKRVEDWYRQKRLILTETPVLDDNGDGKASKEPWRYMIDVRDGLAASEYFLK
jgi:hypothetical protein